MPCAAAAACWKRTCAERVKLLLCHQVSWGCPLSSRSLQAPGAAPCHHAWGGLKDARQPGERVWRADAGAAAVRMAGEGELAPRYGQRWPTGDVGGWRTGHLQTCGEVRTHQSELCQQRGLHRGEVSALSAAFTGLVGKAAEGGMLVGEMSLNLCSCAMWLGAAGRGAGYQSVLPLS